jgi:hypothetical protein
MKANYSMLLAGVAAATFSLHAAAQLPGAATEKKPDSHYMDCSKWKDKARCESLVTDIESCKSKTDDDWRHCMHRSAVPGEKFTPPKARDCSKSRNTARCEAHTAALEACKDKATRAEHRSCMTEQLPVRTQVPGKE